MRIYRTIQASDAKEMSRQGELGFTMIEIAIAIGVIGFALVAIIGILPAGLDVQKDNREDTLVSQDAPYFLDAIRNGAPLTNVANAGHGLDFLTNYVQSIQFYNITNGFTNPPISYSNFYSGAEIIGLLSTPQNNFANLGFASNYFDTVATVRALSGPATEQQTGVNNGVNSVMAFTYQMEVMVTPFNNFAPFTINYLNPSLDAVQSNICYNRYLEAVPGAQLSYTGYVVPSLVQTTSTGTLTYSLFDVRLRFSWPVLANGKVGPGRQTYRTLVAAQMAETTVGTNNCWFFQPQTFAIAYPNGL